LSALRQFHCAREPTPIVFPFDEKDQFYQLFRCDYQNFKTFRLKAGKQTTQAEQSSYGSALLLIPCFWCQITPRVPVLSVMPVNKFFPFDHASAEHLMAGNCSRRASVCTP
jgi:hypothetical protein